MFGKKLEFSLITLGFAVLSLNLNAASYMPSNRDNNQSQNNTQRYNQNSNERAEERDRIMKRDEVDDTDIFAIPLDSSEVEDEEEINRLEGKNTFHLNR